MLLSLARAVRRPPHAGCAVAARTVHSSPVARAAAPPVFKGPASKVPATTIPAALAPRLAHNEYKDAFRDVRHELRWNKLELDGFVRAVAAGLAKVRHEPKDCLMATNLSQEPENLVTMLAALHAGLTYASVPAPASPQQVEDALFAVQPKGMLIPMSMLEPVREILPELQALDYTFYTGVPLRSASFPNLRNVIQLGRETVCGMMTYNDILVLHPLPDPLPSRIAALTPDDVATIHLRQSPNDDGSEPGLHLAAAFTHRAMLATATAAKEWLGLTSADRVCMLLPLSSPVGQSVGTLAPLLADSFIVLPGGVRFDPLHTLATIAREHCSVVLCTPSTLEAMLEHPSLASHDLSRVVAHAEHGGNALSPRLLEAAQRALGSSRAQPTLKIGLATTEGSLVGVYDGEVLKPIANTELRVNGEGVLQVRGPGIMRGYHGADKHAETAFVLASDGWLTTSVRATAGANGLTVSAD